VYLINRINFCSVYQTVDTRGNVVLIKTITFNRLRMYSYNIIHILYGVELTNFVTIIHTIYKDYNNNENLL